MHAVTWTVAAVRASCSTGTSRSGGATTSTCATPCSIPLDEIRAAHAQAKRALLDEVERRTGVTLDPNVFTIGFARRATPYKRADLLFTDLDRLRASRAASGRIQIVYAGKAHPHDGGGKELIQQHLQARASGSATP